MNASRLRVMFDGRAITPHRSGIGGYSFELCRAFLVHHAREMDVLVFDGRAAHDVHDADDILAACAQVRDGDLYRYRGHLAVGGAARAAKADLYHFPDFFAPLHPLGVPMIVTIHDVVPIAHPEYLPNSRKARFSALFRLWARRAALQSRLVLTNSDFSRGEILRHLRLPAQHVRTVYHATQTPVLDVPLPARLATRITAGRYLLYVGRHDTYKGLALLLDAWKDAHTDDALAGFTLVITGRIDPRYNTLAAVSARGLESSVLCTDYVGTEELAALYRNARALAFPSLYEGFGVPALDAMHYDIPVLCSNRASLPEITGGAALLVDPENREAFGSALRSVMLDDTLRTQLIDRGRRRRDAFSWQRVAAETLESYRDAIQTP